MLDVSPEIPSASVPGTALAQPLLQFDGSGNLTIRYLEAHDRIFAEGAVASLTSGDTVNWDLVDNLGSVRAVLDNSGSIIDELVYNSFGLVAYESDPTVAHFTGFSAGHVDPLTGLLNEAHRWYEPKIGRWLSADPSAFAAGDLNLQRYVENDTLNFLDPTGLGPNPNNPYGQPIFPNGSPFNQPIFPSPPGPTFQPLGNNYFFPPPPGPGDITLLTLPQYLAKLHTNKQKEISTKQQFGAIQSEIADKEYWLELLNNGGGMQLQIGIPQANALAAQIRIELKSLYDSRNKLQSSLLLIIDTESEITTKMEHFKNTYMFQFSVPLPLQ